MIRILIISALICSFVGYFVSILFSITIQLISRFFPTYYGENVPIILGMVFILALSLGIIFFDVLKNIQTKISKHIKLKKELDNKITNKYVDGYLYYIFIIIWIVSTTLIPKIMVEMTYGVLNWDGSRFSIGRMLVIAISIVGVKILDGAFREVMKMAGCVDGNSADRVE